MARVSPHANQWAVWADVWFRDGRVVSHFLERFPELAAAQLNAALWGVQLSEVVETFFGDAAVQLALLGDQLALEGGSRGGS